MRSINPGLFEFLNFFLLLESWYALTLEALGYFLTEAFNTCVEKEYVIVSLLEQLRRIVDTRLLVEMIEDYDFALFVLVSVELRDELVSLYAHSRKI